MIGSMWLVADGQDAEVVSAAGFYPTRGWPPSVAGRAMATSRECEHKLQSHTWGSRREVPLSYEFPSAPPLIDFWRCSLDVAQRNPTLFPQDMATSDLRRQPKSSVMRRPPQTKNEDAIPSHDTTGPLYSIPQLRVRSLQVRKLAGTRPTPTQHHPIATTQRQRYHLVASPR